MIKRILLLAICLFTQSTGFCMITTFYIMHNKSQQAISDLEKHFRFKTILIAQGYRIDKNGNVSGELDTDVLAYSKKNGTKLMALVTNTNFDDKAVHQFLLNSDAQTKALTTLLQNCKNNKIYGVQFDFEMIPLADKESFTNFYQTAARILHKNGFAVSFAVAPLLKESDFASPYQKKLYEAWQGSYDLKKLGASADFISVMAYDQHAAGTIPGPVASIVWDEAVIKHALKFIPASKLSLGIPTYSGFWFMGNSSSNRITTKYNSLDYTTLNYILKKYHSPIMWDSIDKINFTFYQHNWMNKYIFIENAKSFKIKVALAKKYHLQGISIFRLGIEDPKIWNVLDATQKKKQR